MEPKIKNRKTIWHQIVYSFKSLTDYNTLNESCQYLKFIHMGII